ncbi:hypothetical protein ACQRBK_08375 [Peptoniphilaceae bacterium SGI.137]|nr:hypothetical protein [Peptoniphilaceae bacterium]MDD7543011.1 hypothetical protein [Peptoniphilaceae bacterium]MDY5765918.1 hypothetical protein [Peptoniphilaceae bacterium]MDY5841615.1 hypothetical protein [Peptoniphilaceae bacterium]
MEKKGKYITKRERAHALLEEILEHSTRREKDQIIAFFSGILYLRKWKKQA